MKMAIREKWLSFVSPFKVNFWNAFLLGLSYFSFFLYAVSIPILSYNNYHIVSIACLALFSIFSLLWLLLYSKIKITNFVFLLALYLIVITFCSLIGRFTHWQQTYYLLPLSCLIIYEFAVDNAHWKIMLRLFFWSLFVFLLVFLLIYRNELLARKFDRLGEWFGNVNTVYKPFALGSCLAFYYALFEKKYWHYFSAVLFSVLGLTTGSKGFLFFVLVGLLTLAVLKNGKKRWWLSCLFVLFLLIIFFITINIPAFAFFKNRILDFLQSFGITIDGQLHYDGSTIERVYMFKESLEDFLMSPLFGWGMDSFQAMSNFPYAHNTFGELMVGFGLFGTVSYALLLIPSFKKMIGRSSERYYPFLIAAFLCLLATHFSTVFFIDKTFWMMLAFFASSSYGFVNKPKPQAIPQIGFDCIAI